MAATSEPWAPPAPAHAPPAGGDYAGLATRTLAFALDAAVINGVAWSVALVMALCLSLLDLPSTVITVLEAIGAAIALFWSVAYFAFFWSTTGQTPGSRVMRIRVEDGRSGELIHGGRAALRVVLVMLSAIPLCAGFLWILVDHRRRALHDLIVRTVVVYVVSPPGRAPASPRARGS